MKTIKRFTYLLVVLFALVWTTSAIASRTYYATFEGCFEAKVGYSPYNGDECFEGRVGFEQQTAVRDMTVTEFWFEVNGERLDIDDFDIEDVGYYHTADEEWLHVAFTGTAPNSQISRVDFQFSPILGYESLFLLEFGSANDYVGGTTFDGGSTILHYPNSAPLEQMNAGLNDAWYDPETAGAGVFVTVLPVVNLAFAAWYTYDTELPMDVANVGDAGHRYLTGVGPISGNRVVIDIDLTSNGLFNTPNAIQQTMWTPNYGKFILTFDTCETGSLQYSIPSANEVGSVPLQRVAGDNVGLCQKLSVD